MRCSSMPPPDMGRKSLSRRPCSTCQSLSTRASIDGARGDGNHDACRRPYLAEMLHLIGQRQILVEVQNVAGRFQAVLEALPAASRTASNLPVLARPAT